MIYLVNRRYAKTVRAYLESDRAQDLADRIRIVAYQDVPRMGRLPTGTYVFSDYERLRSAQWDLVRHVWDRLSEAGDRVRLFNDPRTVLTRGPLLERMYAEGINTFRAVRADALRDDLRYPVFVREEADHTGSLTDLIPDEPTLRDALVRLTGWRTKHALADLLVVEFCDTRMEDGRYRKFSAFRVGDRILARYLTFGDHWVVKTAGAGGSDADIDAEYQYLVENPHEAWLREVFEMSGITFGRMDYGLLGDRPQLWEINTNATIGPMPFRRKKGAQDPGVRAKKEPGRLVFHDAFRDVMRAADLDAEEDAIEVGVGPGLRARLALGEAWNDVRRLKGRLVRGFR